MNKKADEGERAENIPFQDRRCHFCELNNVGLVLMEDESDWKCFDVQICLMNQATGRQAGRW